MIKKTSFRKKKPRCHKSVLRYLNGCNIIFYWMIPDVSTVQTVSLLSFDILEPFSEFRTGSGRGGRGCFLDGAAGVYQVAFFTGGNRLIAELRIRLL